MSSYSFKLPDLGEGTVESEIVEWRVRVGDMVNVDQPLVDIMTDKATIEITAPVSGKVISLGGQPGDVIPVGSELVVFAASPDKPAITDDVIEKPAIPESTATEPVTTHQSAGSAGKPLTSPAIRRLAREKILILHRCLRQDKRDELLARILTLSSVKSISSVKISHQPSRPAHAK